MSGIVEFLSYVYVKELAGIDTGEKCMGDHKNPWAVGCTYGVTVGKAGAGWERAIKTGDWRQDPCIAKCGIWHRVKRLIGRFKAKSKFDYNLPACITSVRGTTFTIDVANDGTTLIVVSQGEVEVVDRTYLQSAIVPGGYQITVHPQQPITKPYEADKNLLDKLTKWRENIIHEEVIEELEAPEGTVIELPKGQLNYTSLERKKGG